MLVVQQGGMLRDNSEAVALWADKGLLLLLQKMHSLRSAWASEVPERRLAVRDVEGHQRGPNA